MRVAINLGLESVRDSWKQLVGGEAVPLGHLPFTMRSLPIE